MKRFAACCLLLCLLSALCVGCTAPEDPTEPITAPEPTVQTVELTDILTPAPTAAPTETPTPVPTDTPEPTPTPTPTPVPTPTPINYLADEGIYTIAWMSDTQHYSKKFPDVYYTMTEFLRDHREELNLQYIIHTGDLIHNIELEEQWKVADLAQSYIDDIPNGVLAGNHDCADEYWYTPFKKYFGSWRYENKPWYGGCFEENRGHFDLITAGETDYLFVYMGYCPSDRAIKWVQTVFETYPERVGVLCLHDYYTNTPGQRSTDGWKWYNQIVSRMPNLYMVCCGHRYGAYCFPESFDDDGDGVKERTVYQMLFNYQATKHDGGGGYLRLIQIDDAAGTMHVLTYSPVTDDFDRFDDPDMRETYYEFDESHEDFTLPLPWRITEQETEEEKGD